MAENDLGDFFAKKDKRKKKKKQGTKVTSATLIEQLISDPGNTEEQPKQQFTDEAHIARPVSKIKSLKIWEIWPHFVLRFVFVLLKYLIGSKFTVEVVQIIAVLNIFRMITSGLK